MYSKIGEDESGPFEMKTILMLICVLNHHIYFLISLV